jgi:hypothetical protein
MAGIWVLLIMIHVKVAKSDLPDRPKNPPGEVSGQG